MSGADNSSTEQEYHFVGKPSEDFFCPVMYGLLLEPHLTTCCGNHLSRDAATRIEGEGRPCPLCKAPHLKTTLNKHFRRQVYELRVFCCHKSRGCGWEGELSDQKHHVQSCPKKNSPLLKKVPGYV